MSSRHSDESQQETLFEEFARQLAQREVCPNLLPHTIERDLGNGVARRRRDVFAQFKFRLTPPSAVRVSLFAEHRVGPRICWNLWEQSAAGLSPAPGLAETKCYSRLEDLTNAGVARIVTGSNGLIAAC